MASNRGNQSKNSGGFLDFGVSSSDQIGTRGSRKKAGSKAKSKASAKSTAKPLKKTKATKPKIVARKKTGKKRKAKKKKSAFAWLFGKLFYWGLVAGVWGVIGLAGVLAYFAIQMPSAGNWVIPERPANIRIIAANGKLIANSGKMGGEALRLYEMPAYLPQAVIAIEDRRYYSHFGFDPIGFTRAMVTNIKRKKLTQGGSTLTQQLAKNLFLTPERTISRKIQEVILSVWLTRNYEKDELLEIYLNRVYLGAGAYGVEAASQTYFGTSASNISLSQAAILAGLLKAPSALAPNKHPERAAARARLVLNAMVREGFISPDEATTARIAENRQITTKIRGAEYYVADWVESLIDDYIGAVEKDIIVETSIDWDLQKYGEFLLRETILKNGEKRKISQGALIALDTNGAVRAVVGGIDYQKSQYNRAVTARRQPGSSFKPIVYLTALEAGLTPQSIRIDEPFTYKDWSPTNASNKYVGRVLLKDALAHSLNTVAARLAIDLGPQNIADTAYRLGISTELNAHPSIALGASEVSLLEMSAAYVPFANGGRGVIAHVINRIITVEGEVLYERIDAGPGRVVSAEHVGMMNEMLNHAVSVGTGKRANLDGWEIAGKTGTSQNYRDAWFIGYSAKLITGVWFGNDDGSSTGKVGGGSLPANVWSDFMKKAHKGVQVAQLPRGSALVQLQDQNQFAEAPATQLETFGNAQAQRTGRTIGDLIADLFGG